MTPKQWIRYVKKLERHNLAICDGTTANMGTNLFDVLYPLFILTGMSFLMWLLMHWTVFRDRMKKVEK